jgi:hypothetical protein
MLVNTLLIALGGAAIVAGAPVEAGHGPATPTPAGGHGPHFHSNLPPRDVEAIKGHHRHHTDVVVVPIAVKQAHRTCEAPFDIPLEGMCELTYDLNMKLDPSYGSPDNLIMNTKQYRKSAHIANCMKLQPAEVCKRIQALETVLQAKEAEMLTSEHGEVHDSTFKPYCKDCKHGKHGH